MKILYGVVGEGMGHAIRSSVILEKLIADGHEVHVVVSGRAHDFLAARFPQVSRIWGLTMSVKDNELKRISTVAKNLREAIKGFPSNVRQYFEVEAQFEPDLVISDFETWTWLFAMRHRLPLICVDNIQVINRCTHDEAILQHPDVQNFRISKSVVKAKAPHASHYVVTSFFFPPVRKKRTTLIPPILRQNILEASPTRGEHLLVYQTSESFSALPEVLRALDVPCTIYGLRRDLDAPVTEGNLTFKPFSETGFVDDLASARGVIASAGFTLLGESMHLGKPYLATPIKGQFEQLMNSLYLERLGYGMYSTDLDLSVLGAFLERSDDFADTIAADYPRQDNTRCFEVLDELFDQVAAGVLKGGLVRV